MKKASQLLFDNDTLQGAAYAREHSKTLDNFVCLPFTDETLTSSFALLAVGGYGRYELCPYSDIDLLLIHDGEPAIAEVAETILYPLWDRDIKVGHAVTSVADSEDFLRKNFNWATSVLSSRLLYGSEELFSAFQTVYEQFWEIENETLMQQIIASTKERKRRYGEVGSSTEPNIKNGRGGLRDIHTLQWAANQDLLFASHLEILQPDFDFLLACRVALHRVLGRNNERLTFDAQDEIAQILGYETSHLFMLDFAAAANRINWYCDDAWFQWRQNQIADLQPEYLPGEPDFEQYGRSIRIAPDVVLSQSDPFLFLRFAKVAAQLDLVMDRDSLSALAKSLEQLVLPEQWSGYGRTCLMDLLLAGRAMIPKIEDLSHYGLMEYILPQWEAVRFHPQRNVLHTFTIDRHLCEAAANAAEKAHLVDRQDLLVVGVFLHDIGKGFPGDHTDVGVELIPTICARWGFNEADIAVLVDLCRLHLLLPDVATRRDLTDPGTIRSVAAEVDDIEFLQLLAILTEADSIATGPSAWGSWKANLVEQLVDRTSFILEGGKFEEIEVQEFPPTELRERFEHDETLIEGAGGQLTVVAVGIDDQFQKIAGVLAIMGLKVLEASIANEVNSAGQMACASRFVLQQSSHASIDWPDVETKVLQALEGRLAIKARLAQRQKELKLLRRRLAAEHPKRKVVFDNNISDSATVVEVHAKNTFGLLYHLATALAEFDLVIDVAKIQTFGPQIVDSFYVRTQKGRKIFDSHMLSEISLALKEVIHRSD